jgi:flagellar biosynthesis/type III secretory pathway protein FliH
VCAENTQNKKEKKSARHKPPSRERYEKANPVWSARLPKPWHGDYEIYVEKHGLSRKTFMGVALGKIKLDYEQVRDKAFAEGITVGHKQGYTQGRNDGFATGKEEGRKEGKDEGYKLAEQYLKIVLCCPACGRLEEVFANSWTYQMLVDFLYHYGWVCWDCYNRRFYR